MKSVCRFNPSKDYVRSTPNLSINLSRAMESGIVPSSGTNVEHNGLEHSSDIGPRVTDSFKAIDMQRQVMALGKAQVDYDKSIAAAAASAAADQTE